MTLVRYQQPRTLNWNVVQQFRNELGHLHNSFERDTNNVTTQGWTPAVDIKELDNEFIISADIPGVNPDDIDIHLEDAVLTIKGKRHIVNDEKQDNYKRQERFAGPFFRRFSLPDSADAEKITATSHNGVLQLIIAKTEKVKPRRINITS